MTLDTTDRVSMSQAKNLLCWGFRPKLLGGRKTKSTLGTQPGSSIRGEQLGRRDWESLGVPIVPPAVLGRSRRSRPRYVYQVFSLREAGHRRVTESGAGLREGARGQCLYT